MEKGYWGATEWRVVEERAWRKLSGNRARHGTVICSGEPYLLFWGRDVSGMLGLLDNVRCRRVEF